MKQKYAWSRYGDDEIWHGGPCDSIKECVREASDEGYSDTDEFAVGFINEYKADIDFAWRIIEDLQEDAFEECGDAADSWLDDVTHKQRDLLNKAVTQVVKDWLKEIKQEPYFYSITPCDEGTLQEVLDRDIERKKDLVKGGKVYGQ